MKIEKITTNNFKGINMEQELTGKDIFIGENGSGKSTRLQALSFALLGYVPGKDKTLGETFKLSSGDSLTAGLTTKEFSFIRSINKKTINKREGGTEDKITEEIEISPSMGEKTLNQKNHRIEQELGNFPVMLDFDEFIHLTDSKRREFIYSLAGSENIWTREKVIEHLNTKLLNKKLEEEYPEQYKVMTEVLQECIKQYPVKFDVQQGIKSMIDWVSKKLIYWKSELNKKQAAVKQLGNIKNQTAETESNITDNKQELEELQDKLITVEKRLSIIEERKNNTQKNFARINEIQNQIKILNNKKNDVNISAVEKEISGKKALIKTVDNTEKIKKVNSTVNAINAKIKELQSELEKIRIQGTAINSERTTYVTTIEKIKNQVGKCVLDSRISCNKNFIKFIEFSNKKIEELSNSRSALRLSYSKANRILKDNLTELKNNEKLKQDLLTEEKQATIQNNKLLMEIAALEKNISSEKNEEKLKSEKIKMLSDELNRLKQEGIPITSENLPQEINIEKQKDGILSNIEILKAKIAEQEKAKIAYISMKQTMLEAKTAQYYVNCFKNLNQELGIKGIQGLIVKDSLEPIRSDIQENLKLLGINNEFYFKCETESGKEIFQFGWINENGRQLNFDALSTGQQLLLLVAFMTTVISKANPKVKILALDNIEKLDEKNLCKVLKGLKAIENKFDNILISGVINPVAAQRLGYKVWDLSESKTKFSEELIA